MSPNPLARILIVDDETANMRALCNTLRDQGYATEGAASGEGALKALQEKTFDLLLTDLMMPGIDGVALLGAALKIDPYLVGILMTGQGTIETAVAAMQAGALDYVLKPVKLSTILPVLSRAVAIRRLRLENLELRNTVAIHELSQAIAYTLDPAVLLDRIADAVLSQFEAEEVSVMLVTEDGESLYVAAVRGGRRERLLGTHVPFASGIAGRAATRREPQVVQGSASDPELMPLHPRDDIQSALSMPMIARNRLIGVLNMSYTQKPRAIPFGQIKVLGIFVNAAAAGMEAARLYESERKADNRYRIVLDMAADAIVSMDQEHRIILFNGAAERIFGWPAAEILGKSLDLLIPERLLEVHQRHIEAFDAVPESTIPMQGRGPFLARRKDGTEFPAEISISRLKENSNHVYTAVLRDITQRVLQEDKISRLSRIRAVLSGINSAIVRIGDRDELFREACRIAVEEGKFRMAWIGLAEPALRKATPVSWMGFDDGYLEDVGRKLDSVATDHGAGGRALREKRPVVYNDLQKDPQVGFRQEALSRGYNSLAVLPLLVADEAVGVLALYSEQPGFFDHEEMKLLAELAGDIAFALDHIAKARKIDYLATRDQVTGLPNRVLFLDRLGQGVNSANSRAESLAVVLADIERFRNVNDSFGRHEGDAVLRQLADRFRSGAMESQGVVARIGGDIFAVIHQGIKQPAEFAKTIGKRTEDLMAAPFDVGGQKLHLAMRAGAAFFPTDGPDADMLLQNAEAALKRAKQRQERVAFYTADLNARVAEQLSLESKLRHALERNEFVLHYQPKVNLETNRVVGLEALIRWQDPDKGLVPPMHFIPLLEQTGLILPVGAWAMQEAVRASAALAAKGLPPVRIAVNVSPIQLRVKDFVRSVKAAVNGSSVRHGLDLEITESVIMEDIDNNVKKLNELRDMDVELSIDDFGTGYSSLAYIARLPVGVIKIDRAFVWNLEEDPNHMSIVQTIIALTHSLKRKVVAEGVETAAQAQILRLLRCNQYQGYLFSKPVPEADIERLLRPVPAP